VGVWQNDRVEIIANDQGNRTTPSYVAFTDTERLIGDAAKNQVAMNPKNTVSTSSNSPLLHLQVLYHCICTTYCLSSAFAISCAACAASDSTGCCCVCRCLMPSA
jgi:hypothetical protein